MLTRGPEGCFINPACDCASPPRRGPSIASTKMAPERGHSRFFGRLRYQLVSPSTATTLGAGHPDTLLRVTDSDNSTMRAMPWPDLHAVRANFVSEPLRGCVSRSQHGDRHDDGAGRCNGKSKFPHGYSSLVFCSVPITTN